MNRLARLSGGQTLALVFLALAILLASILYGTDPFRAMSNAPSGGELTVTETMAEPIPPTKNAPPETPADTAPKPAAPTFDVVRSEQNGSTLVAGTAAPSASVDILLDGVALARASADSSGRFVGFLDLPASGTPRILSLASIDPSGQTPSQDQVILAPTPKPETQAEAAEPAIAATQAPATTAETAPTPDMTEPEVTPTTPAQAPIDTPTQTVLLSTAEGIKVLQAPVARDTAPQVLSNVALDAISYTDDGEVELAGRGLRRGYVRIYLDDAPITTSRIAEDGVWRSDLPDVDSGIYTLRIDEMDAAGKVISRIETPFKRESDAVLAARPTQPDTGDAAPNLRIEAVTVQPGSTLWAIARDTYGSGVQYVRVFEANRDRIRNPDLIYPGQVFTLPEN